MTDLFSYIEEIDIDPPNANKPAPLTVTQLSNQLRLTVENNFGYVEVEGEISTLRTPASGHVYFKLKDSENVLNAIIWRGVAEKLSLGKSVGKLATNIEEGQKVILHGKLTTYGARSEYQIIVNRVEIAGVGDLMQQFEVLKAKLNAEGLFDAERKQKIPMLPEVIGIITSATGAVIEDMLHRISARFPSRVVLWSVLVQGDGAKEQICDAIIGFNALKTKDKYPKPDVIIIARGGGSLEDLWAFNEEKVVRAIANSQIPIISAIGHEPDVTLCDYVADLRAPTPTAAAEMVVPMRQDLQYTVSQLNLRLQQAVVNQIALLKKQLALTVHQLPDPQSQLNQAKLRFEDKQERLQQAQENYFKFLHQKLASQQQLLASFSPKSVQKRGYIYATDEAGKLIESAHTKASDISLHFADGERRAILQKAPPKTGFTESSIKIKSPS